MRRPQRRRPALAQVVKVRLPRLDAVVELGVVDVTPGNHDIERQPDAEIRAHGGIDRHQADLERIVKVDIVGDGAIEHRLAVFVLADLQIGRVLRALDEIAGGVEQEQPRALALDLTAEEERDIELHVGGFEHLAFDLVEFAHGAADALRGLEHGRRVHQRLGLAGRGIFPAFAQRAHDRLADREVAGRCDRHDAVAGLGEDVQLAEGRDIVDAGVGAGVGEHDQAVADEDSTAIGHGDGRIPVGLVAPL